MPIDPYAPIIADAAEKFGVPPAMLTNLIRTESSFNPQAVSSKGAEGVAQFMPATAQSLHVQPFDPKSAINGAAEYLAQLRKQTGSWAGAAAAYNEGPGNYAKYGTQNPEVAKYVSDVRGNPNASPLAALYTPAAPDTAAKNPLETLYSSGGDQPVAPNTKALQAQINAILKPASAAPSKAPDVTAKPTGLWGDAVNDALGFGRGAVNGVNTMLDQPAAWASGEVHKVIPEAPTRQEFLDAAKNYADDTPKSGWTTAGNVAGQIGTGITEAALGGGVLSAAGKAAEVIPVAGRVLAPVARMVAGTAGKGAEGLGGTAVRYGSRILNNALVGGALTAQSTPNGQGFGKGAYESAALTAAGEPILGAAGLAVPFIRQAVNALFGPDKKAGEKLANALITRNLGSDVGKSGDLVLDTNRPVRAMARAVIAHGGPDAARLQTALDARSADAPSQIRQAISDASGVSPEVVGKVLPTIDEITGRMRDQAAPLYEHAFANAALDPEDEHLQQLLKNKTVAKYYAPGLQAMRDEAAAAGHPDPFPEPKPDSDNADTEEEKEPSVPVSFRAAVAAKRGLADAVENAYSSGNKAQARTLRQLHDALNAKLIDASPEYAKANAIWSGGMQEKKAVDLGMKAVNNPDAELAAKQWNALSPNQKELALIGASKALIKKLGASSSSAVAAKKILGSSEESAARQNLRTMLPSNDAYNQFIDRLTQIRDQELARQYILSQSATAETAEQLRQMDHAGLGRTLMDAGRSVLFHDPIGAVQTLGAHLLSRSGKLPPDYYSHITNRLLAPAPTEASIPALVRPTIGQQIAQAGGAATRYALPAVGAMAARNVLTGQ